jgi:nucleotidyltransferase/DNA polymerase involved in DNA repair
MTPVKATRGRLVTTELAAAGRSGRAERPDGAAGPRGQTGGVDDGLRAWVLHVDLDQFIPAVEVLRRPDLAGVPVIVGGRGDPTERAVVSTASYEARAFGVGSGMPLRLAARKAPTAVILPVDAAAYEAASAQVMGVLRGLDGAAVQVLGWDEAFVGVRTGDPEGFARRAQTQVLAATGLHCSVGIGDTKIRAKIGDQDRLAFDLGWSISAQARALIAAGAGGGDDVAQSVVP